MQRLRDSNNKTTTAMTYPKSWLIIPGAKKNNMYANKLSNLINESSGHRNASKSSVGLVHTLSIYGQVDVPICELNKMYETQTE